MVIIFLYEKMDVLAQLIGEIILTSELRIFTTVLNIKTIHGHFEYW